MEEMERDFKGVWIPKEIWLDTRLNALDKIILLEIDSLDKEKGCYASNEYLANFCQCSPSKVKETISTLKKLGYIYIKSFDGRCRFLGSRLTKNDKVAENVRQTARKCQADSQILSPINIDNNINTNTKENNIKEKFKKPTIEEIENYIKELGVVLDANNFYDYYESKGWIIGKTTMKNWKACVRTWVRKSGQSIKEENVAKKEEKRKLAKSIEKQIEEQIKKQQEELLKS